MSASYDGLLNQISRLAEDGQLGPDAEEASRQYSRLPSGSARCVAFVRDFALANVDEEMKPIRSLLCQLVLVAYRDAKKENPQLARDFAYSFHRDYSGMAGSALLLRWSSLADASFAFQMVAQSGSRLLAWQQSSRLVLAVNEFLDGLIGLLILAWRCALGKRVNPNVLGNAYGSKIKEFADLTEGDDGAFYLLLRIADAELRNGLAHHSAWLDSDANKVRYVSGQQQKTEHEMDLFQFMSMATIGSHLGAAYVAALATIAVLESGQMESVAMLPPVLVEVMSK